jgi:hypothetical protein
MQQRPKSNREKFIDRAEVHGRILLREKRKGKATHAVDATALRLLKTDPRLRQAGLVASLLRMKGAPLRSMAMEPTAASGCR